MFSRIVGRIERFVDGLVQNEGDRTQLAGIFAFHNTLSSRIYVKPYTTRTGSIVNKFNVWRMTSIRVCIRLESRCGKKPGPKPTREFPMPSDHQRETENWGCGVTRQFNQANLDVSGSVYPGEKCARASSIALLTLCVASRKYFR